MTPDEKIETKVEISKGYGPATYVRDGAFEIRKSKIHGRGVFATRDIKIGELFECEVLLMPSISTELSNYQYPWVNMDNLAICLGWPSFLNDSGTHNIKIAYVNTDRLTITFKVIKDINDNEEVLINYREVYQSFLFAQ